MTSQEFSTSRYERNFNGSYDYVIEVDVGDFLPSQVCVNLSGYVITVQAETHRMNQEGNKVRHQFLREIQLPLNVITSGLRYRYLANGLLELRAPVESAECVEIIRYPKPVHACENGIISSTNMSTGTVYRSRSRSPYRGDYTLCRSCSPAGRAFRSRSKTPPIRIVYDYSPRHIAPPMTTKPITYVTSDYLHKVEIDPVFKPENISVMVESGVVIIKASVDRDPRLVINNFEPYGQENWSHREFKCEHILPYEVDASALKAELVRGYLLLRAPYKMCTHSSRPRTPIQARIVYDVPIESF